MSVWMNGQTAHVQLFKLHIVAHGQWARMQVLVLCGGNSHELTVSSGEVKSVGRSRACDIFIAAQEKMSSRHVQLSLSDNNDLQAQDVSTNG